MPSYEPTPKRFSTLSVSRTSSRRNSIDDASRPSLAVSDGPVFPPLASPLDLVGALKQLQHTQDTADGEGEVERGRTRQSSRHRRSATAWGHDPVIQMPAARRNNSASARELIATWEERSRSQSMGRSKSRGRDLGAGSRVSVVPEMPELPAGFTGMDRSDEMGTNANSTNEGEESRARSDTLKTLEGNPATTESNHLGENEDEDTTSNNVTYATLSDIDHAVWSEGLLPADQIHVSSDYSEKERENSPRFGASTNTWTDDVDQSPPPSPHSDRSHATSESERPHTPVGTALSSLPTPDATPRKTETRNDGSNIQLEESPVTSPFASDTPFYPSPGLTESFERTHNPQGRVVESTDEETERPSTPVNRVNFPPTPEATPGQVSKATEGFSSLQPGRPEQVSTPEVESRANSSIRAADYPPIVELKSTRHTNPENEVIGSPVEVDFVPLPQPLSQELDNERRSEVKPEPQQEEVEVPPELPPRPAPAPLDGTNPPKTRYHDVWKITGYAPEFPLPSNPTAQVTLDHDVLARVPFDGNPLQQPPKSQLSAAAAAYRPKAELKGPEPRTRSDDDYPYSTSQSSGTGHWVVDIPPSPTSAYIPDQHRPGRQAKPRSRSRNRNQGGGNDSIGAGRYTSRGGEHVGERERHAWDAPSVIERAFHAASVSMIQGFNVPMGLYRGLRDVYYPPPERPDIIKAYPVRRRLPIRIFFPVHYDLTSPALLPTLFTLHGGGFTVGLASDDDLWNRTFADTYTVLVIALNYSKAPWTAFPAPLHDVEALYHAVLNDESLPIDRMRTALSGFDAGANLALALSQLPSVKSGQLDPNLLSVPLTPGAPSTAGNRANRHRSMYFPTAGPHVELPPGYQPNSHRHDIGTAFPSIYPPNTPFVIPKSHPPPSAVIPISGILDFTTPASHKSRTRPYKRSLRGPRGWGPGLDWMARLLPSSAWSYIPYGHDTADPLLSPLYADRKDLPPHVFVIAAELDCLAHESWRAVCSWAGRAVVPDGDVSVGRRGVSRWRGCLDDGEGLDGGKFGWFEEGEGQGSTRWLLVPDVVHGFDSAPWRNKYLWGDQEARMDAEMKTIAYQREMAEWLWGTVWR